VLALVSHGAEVIADGHVHVYAPLRGRAIAGAKGYAEARIFTTAMQAQLLAIAGAYRTTEDLPPAVAGRAAMARLSGGSLQIEPIESGA
jgi:septum site-determining protein MinC